MMERSHLCMVGLFQASVQEDVLSHWSENMSKLAHDGDWRVRFALLQVLEVLGKSSDGERKIAQSNVASVISDTLVSDTFGRYHCQDSPDGPA